MMSPEDERRRLLGEAINRATETLREPLDRIEVTPSQVTCWAGSRGVVMDYAYAEGGTVDEVSGRFVPTLGGGSWRVVVAGEPRRSNRLFRAISVLFGRG
jgi:hypothetical protein